MGKIFLEYIQVVLLLSREGGSLRLFITFVGLAFPTNLSCLYAYREKYIPYDINYSRSGVELLMQEQMTLKRN